jgi:hypothetical protein
MEMFNDHDFVVSFRLVELVLMIVFRALEVCFLPSIVLTCEGEVM